MSDRDSVEKEPEGRMWETEVSLQSNRATSASVVTSSAGLASDFKSLLLKLAGIDVEGSFLLHIGISIKVT